MSKKDDKKWEKAVWQYLIDHSRPKPSGAYFVSFHTKNQKEFFYRVKARYRGTFKRVDLKEQEERLALVERRALLASKKIRKQRVTRQIILSKGNLWDKILIKILKRLIHWQYNRAYSLRSKKQKRR